MTRKIFGKLGEIVAIVLISLVVAEAATRYVIAPLTGRSALDRDSYFRELEAVEKRLGERMVSRAQYRPDHVSDQTYQHPFLGFIPRADLDAPCGPAFPIYMCVTGRARPINSLGLYEDEFPFQPGAGSVRIGIIGGSVANLMVQAQADALARVLESKPVFAGKKVEVLNLALPGYKQPQQANLALFLVLAGYKFDAIVDVSGLNEVYLSRHYNIENDVSYLYPFMVHWFPSQPPPKNVKVGNPKVIGAEARLAWITSLAPRKSLFSRSAFMRWMVLTTISTAESGVRGALHEAIDTRISRQDRDYLYQETSNRKCADADCTDERVRLWKGAALATAAFLERQGTRYFEVLQPNHYAVPPDSISPADRRMISAEFGWSASDQAAWNAMRQEIVNLRHDGVRAADFSAPFPFDKNGEGVLVDPCCHLSMNGYATLAAKLAGFIADVW